MRFRMPRFLTPATVASAHCDLPCGVYDPAQA
ncbi:MAG: superoxide dismutase, Ni, partial [Hamadaea sp.]|nr:superoxide dismutase, Ni [Hamadaea sp.]